MTALLHNEPTSSLDPYSDEYLQDPYPALEELRNLGPAVRLEAYDVWMVARYQDVRSVLADHERFSSAHGVGYEDALNEPMIGTVIGSDPPHHEQMRAVLSSKLAPRAIARLRHDVVDSADALVAALIDRGSFDAVGDLAVVFPVNTVSELVGLPDDARDRLTAFAEALFNVFGPLNERTMASLPILQEVNGYLATVMVPGRVKPGSWTEAVYAAADQQLIEHSMVIPSLLSFIGPSMDTTISAIGSAVKLLAEHPEQYRLLQENPDLLPAAFEEVIRLESPVQLMYRRATTDVDIDGVTVPAGAKVLVSYASANRDPRQWSEPDRFDITRKVVGHMAFGYGIHGCAGQALARLEVHSILRALLSRAETLELAGDPRYKLNNVTRGLASLPVVTTKATNR